MYCKVNMRINLVKEKKDLILFLVALISLLLFVFFPANNSFQEVVKSLLFLLIIPLLSATIVLKEKIDSLGLQKGNWKQGLFWMIFSGILGGLVFYVILEYTPFRLKFALPSFMSYKFFYFILYEIFIAGFFLALYEFFFRGVLMLKLMKPLGNWSIVLQALAVILFFWATQNVNWDTVQYMILAPLAGITAYKSQSLVYSFGGSLLFIFIANSLAIGLVK